MKTRDRGLTPKQARFVEEYLIDLNATRAARRAGYESKTKNGLSEIGYQLLQVAPVSDAIASRTTAVQRKLKLTQHRVLQELALIGFSDLGEFVKWVGADVDLVDSKTLKIKKRRIVKSVKSTWGEKGGSVSIELHDKLGALKTLAQYTGITKGENNGDDSANGKSDSGRAEGRAKARSLAVQRVLQDGEEGDAG